MLRFEVQRLEKAVLSSRQDLDEMFGPGNGTSAYGPSEWFVFIIDPDNKGNRTVAAEFWEMIVDEKPDPEFVSGFAEGSLAVWAAVKDEL